MRFTGFATGILLASPASAAITIDFDGIRNYDRPAAFYDGGSSIDAGTDHVTGLSGQNLGVSITDAAIVFQAFDQCPGGGCNGIFPKAPTGNNAMYNWPARTWLPAMSTFNVAAGFSGEASVWHYGGASSFTIYAGLGGSEGASPTVLGFAAMPLTTGCTVDPGTLTVSGCGWTKYTVQFSGAARSIRLAGSGSYFDSISLGAPGVPEPESWALLVLGFALTGAAMRRRGVITRVAA